MNLSTNNNVSNATNGVNGNKVKAKPKEICQAFLNKGYEPLNNNKPSPLGLAVRRYIIVGERRLSNYWWTLVIFLGACGFLYTGFSAYMGQSLLSLITKSASDSNSFGIEFFPQGLLMSFYGSLGLLLSFYWILLIFWNVGGGFNEFNKKEGFIRIFRWGYPGKNRKIDFIYALKDVEAIRVEIKQGFDPQRTIYLRLKGGPSALKLGIPTFDQGTDQKKKLGYSTKP